MPVKLYKLEPCPPARAFMMALDVFGVPAEMIDVNILAMEHLTSGFLKLNPQHTIPVLEDGDLTITDSHAILQYLADTYAKDDTWYPKDVKKCALVNQMLFFEACVLFPRMQNITYPLLFNGVKEVPQEKWDKIKEAYGFLEEYLSRNKFLASDTMTIVDLAALTSVKGLNILLPLDSAKYPKTHAWLKTMEKQSFSVKYNEPGHNIFNKMIKDAFAK